ncbi:hypothetical protein VFPFJ_03767 [Purpureocillium lilacinum]|uniref:Uncharacterized protein n=1 Tax=Purpureocillium lilacinum TaxID=33203 RepID=A0A179HNX5_PURLI|nr:hypothetical protein VFPFJ_03767 [Purpureocillium lilacinum]OAQ92027.1 hypothetical protein VFPFJ_03767 [Purpureocillium lilacinum]
MSSSSSSSSDSKCRDDAGVSMACASVPAAMLDAVLLAACMHACMDGCCSAFCVSSCSSGQAKAAAAAAVVAWLAARWPGCQAGKTADGGRSSSGRIAIWGRAVEHCTGAGGRAAIYAIHGAIPKRQLTGYFGIIPKGLAVVEDAHMARRATGETDDCNGCQLDRAIELGGQGSEARNRGQDETPS